MHTITFDQALIINVRLWKKSFLIAFLILIIVLTLGALIQASDFLIKKNVLIKTLLETFRKLTSVHDYLTRFLGYTGAMLGFYCLYRKCFFYSLKKQYKTLPTNLDEDNYANLRFYYFRVLCPIVDFLIYILVRFCYVNSSNFLFIKEENYKTFQLEFVENQPDLKFYLINCLLNYVFTVLAVSSFCYLFLNFTLSQSILSQFFLTKEFPGKAWVVSLPLSFLSSTFILQWQLNKIRTSLKL